MHGRMITAGRWETSGFDPYQQRLSLCVHPTMDHRFKDGKEEISPGLLGAGRWKPQVFPQCQIHLRFGWREGRPRLPSWMGFERNS